MEKTKLEVTRIYNTQDKLEDIILKIIEIELESRFDELYNKTQTADTVINQKEERLVA